MTCPKCKGENLRCVDSRPKNEHTKRRHVCVDCGFRFNTIEIYADEYRRKQIGMVRGAVKQ